MRQKNLDDATKLINDFLPGKSGDDKIELDSVLKAELYLDLYDLGFDIDEEAWHNTITINNILELL